MDNIIIKFIDLIYLTSIYVLLGIFIGSLTEKFFVKIYGHLHDNIIKYDNKSISELLIEIICQMFIVAIIYYYFKHILLNIPMIKILDNDISTAKSYDLTIIFTFPFFSFQQNLEDKFIYLLNRMNKYNIKISNY